jgi:Flp pilus assembly protein TadD
MTLRTWICAGLAALTLFAATPAAAIWRKAESENFILYSRADEKKIREQITLLEDYHNFLRLLTGVSDPPSPNKLPVYLVRGRAELRSVRNLPKDAAGFYSSSSSGIAAFSDDKGARDSAEQILLHEIAHHFMLQYRPAAYPAWFIEGFAEYVMTAKFEPDQIEYGLHSEMRTSWLSHKRWLPWERVLFSPVQHKGADGALYYGQSWLLTHFIMQDSARRAKFTAYLRTVTDGTDPKTAFKDQFGDINALDRAVDSYASKGLPYIRMKRASASVAPAMRIEELPASADDLLLSDAAMQIGVLGDSGPFLQRIRAEATKYGSDPYARRVLAKAETLYGDKAKGEKLLDELLATGSGDAELLYLRGMRHLLAGRDDEGARERHFKLARPWFVKAHKADPNHFQTLARYAESLSNDGRFNSDNTMNVVLLAHELAPQVSELRMNAANLLILRKHYEAAEQLLLPLAADPHNPSLATAAQRMIAKARANGEDLPPQPAEDAQAATASKKASQ